jgi:hypothetical protein
MCEVERKNWSWRDQTADTGYNLMNGDNRAGYPML